MLSEEGKSFEYSINANAIIDAFNPCLIDFFNESVLGTELENQIYDNMSVWYSENGRMGSSVSLFDLTCFVLQKYMLQYNDTKSALLYFKEARRNRKNYLFRIIQNEYSNSPSAKKHFLSDYADAYFSIMQVEGLTKYKSKQEFIDTQYSLICDWRSSKETYLIDFKFFNNYSERQKAADFEVDLGCEIFSILVSDFHGQIGDYAVRFPNSLLNGMFTVNKESLELDIAIDDSGQPISKNTSVIKHEDGSEVVVETIVERLPENLSELDEVAKKDKLELISSKGFLPTGKVESLSSIEYTAIAIIYRSFDASVLNQQMISLNGLNFCKSILGKENIRTTEIKKCLHALEKLASTEIRLENRRNDGEVVNVTLASFFDLSYGMLDQTELTSSIISLQNKKSDFIANIAEDILLNEDWVINIYPSYYLKQHWQEDVNSVIYKRQYDKISDSRTRTFMLLFQNERLLYPDLENRFFSYGFFRSKLRLSGRISRVKSDIYSQLNNLIAANIIISSYDIQDNGVVVHFRPFTELEKELYFGKRGEYLPDDSVEKVVEKLISTN